MASEMNSSRTRNHNNGTRRGERKRRFTPRVSRETSQNNRRSRKIAPIKKSPTYMQTVHETSAGGLIISGLAESVGPKGVINFDTIYAALIGRIDRRGRLLWSMPKGHVENGEKYSVTAEREVWEETGIRGSVLAKLGTVDYWFVADGSRIHKSVHHFLLSYQDGELNDEDPEVTEVAWFPINTLSSKLSYSDERKLAQEAIKKIPYLAREAFRRGSVTPR